ncbi:hypothetical protein LCGC14_2464920 [marine sediment metagenome]|uniref:Uncharacterized protein n=1 Tax=marine sediment metagenome TaxID=412755 RepID=A0A0F9BZV4_9ZZZZ
MKILAKEKRSYQVAPLKVLFEALEERAEAEKFVQKAIGSCIEDLKQHDLKADETQGEVIGSLSDQDLIDLLAEKIYLETLIEACETKISAARWRHKTVRERFKQVVGDRFDLPDDEPIKVDIENMKVLRGDREARIEDIRGDVCRLFEADEEELKEIIRKKGEGSLEGDLATVLMEDHREETIKLCNEIFQATGRDRDFLAKVINDEDIPKAIMAIAEFVMKERGLECRKEKIIEWR